MGSTVLQRLGWCSLLLVFFYVSGCIVFINCERAAELKTYAQNRALYEKMKELYSFKHCADPAFKGLSFCKDQKKFSGALKEYFNKHGNSIVDLGQWTVLGTLFFLTHLATTVGYGNNHPQTALGQLATILFALIGIPIMGYTLAQIAQLNLRLSLYVLEKVSGRRVDTFWKQVVVLWGLLVLFLFGGAFVYYCLETWNYLECLYFCFVTLSTVGFGDYLPSSPASKAFSIFYMVFGLGICASIIAVATGMVEAGHDNVDSWISRKVREHCPALCSTREEAEPR